MANFLTGSWKRTFGAIWIGQAFSLFGSMLVQFALVWWLTQKTGSATILAIASLVALLPQVLLGPIAGAIVDRVSRKRMMIIADGMTALVTLALVFIVMSGNLQTWHIYVAMFLRSLGGAFHWPAMQSSTSLLVPDEHLSRVAGLNQALQGAMNIIAPPTGALLLGVMKLEWVLSIDVITALLAILPVLFVSIPQPKHDVPVDMQSPIKTIMLDVKEGFIYVWNWKGLMIILLMAVGINFLISPAFALLPLLVTKHFNAGALQYSWLESAIGIGIVAGGVGLGVWGGFKKKVYTSGLGLLGMGVGTLMVGIAPSSAYWIALAGMFVLGVMNPMTNGPLFALVQSRVDKEKQGRVMTLINSFSSGMVPLAMIIAGPLADRYGVQTWFVLGGIVCVLMAIGLVSIPAVVHIEDDPIHAEDVLRMKAESVA